MASSRDKRAPQRKPAPWMILSDCENASENAYSLNVRKAALGLSNRELEKNIGSEDIPMVIKVERRLKPFHHVFPGGTFFTAKKVVPASHKCFQEFCNMASPMENMEQTGEVSKLLGQLGAHQEDTTGASSLSGNSDGSHTSRFEFPWPPMVVKEDYKSHVPSDFIGIKEQSADSSDPLVLIKLIFCQRILNMTEAMDLKVDSCKLLTKFLSGNPSWDILSKTSSDSMEELICLCHDKLCVIMEALTLLKEQQIFMVTNDEQMRIWLLHDAILCSLQAYMYLRTVISSDILHNMLLPLITITGKTLLPQSGYSTNDIILNLQRVCSIQKMLMDKKILQPLVCHCQKFFIALKEETSCQECQISNLYSKLCESFVDTRLSYATFQINESKYCILDKLLPRFSWFLSELMKYSPEDIELKMKEHFQKKFLCNTDSGLYPCEKHCSTSVCKCFLSKPKTHSFKNCQENIKKRSKEVNCGFKEDNDNSSSAVEENGIGIVQGSNYEILENTLCEKNILSSEALSMKIPEVNETSDTSNNFHDSSSADLFEDFDSDVVLPSQECSSNVHNHHALPFHHRREACLTSYALNGDNNLSDSDLSKSTVAVNSEDDEEKQLYLGLPGAQNTNVNASKAKAVEDPECSVLKEHTQKEGMKDLISALKEPSLPDRFPKKVVSFREPVEKSNHLCVSSEKQVAHLLPCNFAATVHDQDGSSEAIIQPGCISTDGTGDGDTADKPMDELDHDVISVEPKSFHKEQKPSELLHHKQVFFSTKISEKNGHKMSIKKTCQVNQMSCSESSGTLQDKGTFKHKNNLFQGKSSIEECSGEIICPEPSLNAQKPQLPQFCERAQDQSKTVESNLAVQRTPTTEEYTNTTEVNCDSLETNSLKQSRKESLKVVKKRDPVNVKKDQKTILKKNMKAKPECVKNNLKRESSKIFKNNCNESEHSSEKPNPKMSQASQLIAKENIQEDNSKSLKAQKHIETTAKSTSKPKPTAKSTSKSETGKRKLSQFDAALESDDSWDVHFQPKVQRIRPVGSKGQKDAKWEWEEYLASLHKKIFANIKTVQGGTNSHNL